VSRSPSSSQTTSVASAPSRNFVVALSLLALTIASACASRPPADSHPPALIAPLASSSTTSSDAWAIVPMGHLDDPLNTFWQLLYRPSEDAPWTVVTPPGVADNGGLVMTTGPPGAVTVGFEPSQNLLFSPLALSSDHGSTWSPGLVSGSLAPDPDVLADTDAGTSLAVVRPKGGRVLESAAGANGWRTIVSRDVLGKTVAGEVCGIGTLTAVTVEPPQLPLIGTTCSSNRVGIFSGHAGDWNLTGPQLPHRGGVVSTGVLRMVTNSSGVSSLLDLNTRHGSELVASWRSATNAPWTVSSSFSMGVGHRLISSAVAPDGSFIVEMASTHGPPSLVAISGPGARWRETGSVPLGTETVVANADGAIDALSVHQSQLIVWELAAGSASWVKGQVLNVPIDYESSN
jgi:hypothetical protein